MSKNFDDLTIVDDYMFCTVLQDDTLCMQLLDMVLKHKIHKISKIIHQKTIDNTIASKSIRLDIMIEDDSGKLYDVEMQTTDQKNLAKRLRYYQCAIDESSLSKGKDYEILPDTFIIFFCTFDYLKRNLPVYTIQPMCSETGEIFKDGTTKIIINSKAAEEADPELRAFLQYMNGSHPSTDFTAALAKRVSETKENEMRRREYMRIQSFEMDARRAGIAQGFADGVRKTTLKTAAALRSMGFDISQIMQATGLTKDEIEQLPLHGETE